MILFFNNIYIYKMKEWFLINWKFTNIISQSFTNVTIATEPKLDDNGLQVLLSNRRKNRNIHTTIIRKTTKIDASPLFLNRYFITNTILIF